MGQRCYKCGSFSIVKNGVSAKGFQRYRCSKCGRSYTSKTQQVYFNSNHLTSDKSSNHNSSAEKLNIPSAVEISNHSQQIGKSSAKYDTRLLIDLILTALFGWAGYWRFKNKQIGLGILWLLTFGLFFIGWIIDTIIVLVIFIKSIDKSAYQLVQPQLVQPQLVQPQLVQPQLVQPQLVQSQLAQPQAEQIKETVNTSFQTETDNAPPVFPDEIDDLEKQYEYADVKLYTLPQEFPNFKAIQIYGNVIFTTEPENEYDDQAVYVSQNGLKLGYLYKGTLQKMVHDYFEKSGIVLGYVSKLDYQNGVIYISMAYYA